MSICYGRCMSERDILRARLHAALPELRRQGPIRGLAMPPPATRSSPSRKASILKPASPITRRALRSCAATKIRGDATRHIPDQVNADNRHIPWQLMAAMRNRIVHGYFGIDDPILFTTLNADLKPSLPGLERRARQHGAGGQEISE